MFIPKFWRFRTVDSLVTRGFQIAQGRALESLTGSVKLSYMGFRRLIKAEKLLI